MTIDQLIRLRADGIEYTSPGDFLEVVVGLRPCSNAHPPSLKNPTPVKVPMAQDGWKPGASKEARRQAKADLLRAIELGRRQIGIPQGGITAPIPQFPSIDRWT